MNRIILVKHAYPVIDPSLPSAEWVLSEGGRNDSIALAQQLARYDPDGVVTSCEPKAAETGEIVARELQLPVSTMPDLHEHDRSNVEVLPSGEFQESVRQAIEHPSSLVFGMETADQARTRFCEALNRVVEREEFRCPVVVAHGTVISLFVSRISDEDPYELWKKLELPSYIVIEMPDWRIERVVPNLVAD